MNRVCLAGTLAAEPARGKTPCGKPTARLLLRVPRQGNSPYGPAACDEVQCIAVGPAAAELAAWAVEGELLNPEGRLLEDPDRDPVPDRPRPPVVVVDHAYSPEPAAGPGPLGALVHVHLFPRETADPASLPRAA